MKSIMKKVTFYLVVLFCSISFSSAYAQKTKAVQKIYKEVKSAVKNVKPPRRATKIFNEKEVIEERKCSNCNGSGIVVQYNPYTDSYYNAYCSSCSGRGKILVKVKKRIWE